MGSWFLVKMDQWSKGYPFPVASAFEPSIDLSVDIQGDILAATRARAANFGAGSVEGDLVIAKMDPSGNLLWSRGFGERRLDDAFVATPAIAADADGDIIVVGSFAQTVDFGGYVMMSAGGSDVFVVKLDPEGTVLWARRFGGEYDDVATGVDVGERDEIAVTGRFSGDVEFGEANLSSAGLADVFVVKLAP